MPASTDDRFAKMAPYASEGGGAFQPAARAALQLAPGPSGPCRGPAALGLVRDAGVAGIALDATPRLPSLRFDRALFERVMAVVDLMLLDVASLAFPPSLLVAAALYVVTADGAAAAEHVATNLPVVTSPSFPLWRRPHHGGGDAVPAIRTASLRAVFARSPRSGAGAGHAARAGSLHSEQGADSPGPAPYRACRAVDAA